MLKFMVLSKLTDVWCGICCVFLGFKASPFHFGIQSLLDPQDWPLVCGQDQMSVEEPRVLQMFVQCQASVHPNCQFTSQLLQRWDSNSNAGNHPSLWLKPCTHINCTTCCQSFWKGHLSAGRIPMSGLFWFSFGGPKQNTSFGYLFMLFGLGQQLGSALEASNLLRIVL